VEHELSKPDSLFSLGSKVDEYNVQAHTTIKYFLEIVEWRLITASPSLLAAALLRTQE